MTLSVAYGMMFAIISMLCNGSFSSLNKLPSVVKSKISPQTFNLYFIFGCIISCIIVYVILIGLGETITITYLGIISGFLLSLAGITTFAAIGHIGLAVGVAVWSGTAILVSFIEGLLVKTSLYSWPLAVIGVIVLLIGLTVVSFSEMIAQICCAKAMEFDEHLNHSTIYNKNNNINSVYSKSHGIAAVNHSNAADNSLIDSYRESQTLLEPETPRYDTSTESRSRETSKLRENQNVCNDDEVETYDEEVTATRWFLGIFYAILTGILGGSIGFPSTWTDDNNHDAKYLISFAIGATMVFPITWMSECFCTDHPTRSIKWQFKICFIPGFMAGVIWNGGNLASLYAIEILGYSVAYPIMQSSLIIASMWGIFVWKEFRNKYTITFIFVGAITVVAGCAIITYGVDA